MDPKLWGNGVWVLLFYLSVLLVDDLEKLKHFIYLIFSSLPCNECKEHALNSLEKNNIISSADYHTLIFFLIDLRNGFQEKKQNTLMIIPKNKIQFKDNRLTLKSKAEIFSRFCYEFPSLTDKKIIEKIDSKFKKLLCDK